VCLHFIFVQESRKQVWGRSLDTLNTLHSTIQVHTLHTLLYTYNYLDYADYCFRHDKFKRLKYFWLWLISICDISWKLTIIENYFKTLCHVSQYGIFDGRVWVSYSWYHCCLENLFQTIQNSSYHPQCFLYLIKLKILIMITKAIYSVLSLFKMS